MPDNQDQKIELSRDLFGSTLIHAIDYWLDIAKDLLDNEVPIQPFERQNKAAKTDKLYRETFSKLDDHTKKIILQLIASTASGVVYSILLDLDRYHFGDIEISFKPKTSTIVENIHIASPFDERLEELHTDSRDRIEKFSKYKELLMST